MEHQTYRKGFLAGVCSCFCGMLLLLLVLNWTGVIHLSRVLYGSTGEYAKLEETILDKVSVLETYIEKYYLDEIDEEEMANAVYKGVVNGLGDTYAAYYTEEEYEEIQESTQGTYCGIGAYLTTDTETGFVMVVRPIAGSPAEEAGLETGDLIYMVDGEDVSEYEISQVQALVKGEQGTDVELTLLRGNETVTVTVTRDEIEVDTVSSSMLDGNIGYLSVSSFEEVTSNQFRSAIDELEDEGMEALIIDLRDNGGGLLDTAVDMLDRMLPEGLLVYSLDKDGNKEEYMAEDEDEFDQPLVILVNGNSASASEVFSGAIQDYGIGTLIGTQTFGKGIVQSVFGLGDGSALKLTTARYYTPNGRNIHGTGLTPEVTVELSDETENLPESGTEVDNQLKTAWEYLYDEIN